MPPVSAQRIVFVPPERSENMRPSRSRLALLLSLTLLAGLAGCGQASSDSAPSLESRVGVGGPPLSKPSPSPGNNPLTPVTPAASPVPLASGDKPGIPSGKETVPGGDRPLAVPLPSSQPADSVDALVVPAWIAKELDSPDVGARIRALETWVQSAPPGSIDPLILAYEDKDERVRARAMELIEQDWARAADAEQSGEGAEDTSGEAENTNGIAVAGDTETLGEQLAIDPLKKMNQLKIPLKIPFRANQERLHERRMTISRPSSSQSRPYHTTSKEMASGPILRFCR